MRDSWSNRREIGGIVLVLGLFGLVVWASHRHGAPDPLPDVALGWALLLHVERAVVLLGAVGAVALVGWRAVRGDLPVKLGQIEYAVKEATTGTEAFIATQEERIREVEAAVGIRRSQKADPDHPDP